VLFRFFLHLRIGGGFGQEGTLCLRNLLLGNLLGCLKGLETPPVLGHEVFELRDFLVNRGA